MGGPGSGKPAGYGSLKGFKKNTDFFGNERLTKKTKQGGLVHIYKNGKGFRVDTGDYYNDFKTLKEAVKFTKKYNK